MAKVNLFYINEKCIHEHRSVENKPFMAVSVFCYKSASGFASITVEPEQIVPCVVRGELVKGRRIVNLGDEKDSRTVSICLSEKTETAPAVYKSITLTNAEILAMHSKSRNKNAYARSRQMALAGAINKIDNAINAENASDKSNSSVEMTVKTNVTVNSDNKMVIETVIDRC